MIHVYLRDDGVLAIFDCVACSGRPDDAALRYDCDRFGVPRCPSLSKSFFSCAVAAEGVVAAFPKSNAVPGVFGVLVAEPKDPKAPEPKAKAEAPPVVGEATELALSGVFALKGLLLLEDTNLFCPDCPSCRSVLFMSSESFCVLYSCQFWSRRERSKVPTLSGESKDYPCPFWQEARGQYARVGIMIVIVQQCMAVNKW